MDTLSEQVLWSLSTGSDILGFINPDSRRARLKGKLDEVFYVYKPKVTV